MKRTTRGPTGAQFMLRCSELGLSDDALSTMTMGMVVDMFIEQANDHEQYPIKADQEEIKRFFGG